MHLKVLFEHVIWWMKIIHSILHFTWLNLGRCIAIHKITIREHTDRDFFWKFENAVRGVTCGSVGDRNVGFDGKKIKLHIVAEKLHGFGMS